MTTQPVRRAAAGRRLIVVAGILAVLGLALPVSGAAAAAGPAFGLRVFTGENPNYLTFRSANCSVRRRTFGAVGYDKGWRLTVQLHPFTGFHPYKLERGHFNGTFMSLVFPPSGAEYASDFIPPHRIPSGGQINFSDHGNLMGGGFYPMFSANGNNAVGVAGGLRCHYPKKRRR